MTEPGEEEEEEEERCFNLQMRMYRVLRIEAKYFGAFGVVTLTLTSPRKHFTRQVELLSGPKYGNMSNMCIYTHAQTNTVTHVDRKLEADVVAIYRGKRILYLLDSEFKRTTDQRADFEKKATVRAEEQYEDVVGALTEVGRDMGRQWKVKLLTFVGGTCGSGGAQGAP
jgi:hypothetical protein